MVKNYWVRQYPGHSIQGYLLEEGKIELFRDWNKQERDEDLFRDIFDECLLVFYSFPAENSHLIFLSNKMTFEEFLEMIKFEEIKAKLEELNK